MLAGFILIVTGAFFMAAGVVLPRLIKPITDMLGAMPQELMAAAGAAIPGAGLLRLLPLLGWVVRAMIGAGIVAFVFGLYGLFARPTPLWLSILGGLAALLLIVGGGGLAIAARKFSPALQQFSAMKNMFRM